MPTSGNTQNIAVIVATIGRPDVVSSTLRWLLARQTLKPSRVIVSCVDRADAGDLVTLEGVEVVTGPKGLPCQRNTALNLLCGDTDMVVFFDDDFVADPAWLAAAADTFAAEADIIAFTGLVLADGIKGPGLSFDAAVTLVEAGATGVNWVLREPYSPYGCNMAFRFAALGDKRFDERLVLYGWLEDRDFAASLAKSGGRLVKCAAARGVHMGTKRGRIQGLQLGYSQVINPLYMLRKGTLSRWQAAAHLLRNLSSNLVFSLKPEPYIDRRGRLRGNLMGLRDALRGQLEPERAAFIRAI
jgi:glycosyltransferase involved in cell wall biosynthesis